MFITEWLGENNKIGIDIWQNKYRKDNESFDAWLNRVANNNEKVKYIIKSKYFIPGGRILSNRGLKEKGVTYSNCYVITPPEDNLESIYDSRKKLARTYSYGGGCGIDISKLAPSGAVVNNQAEKTSGAVSFMDGYSKTTSEIGQNGRRGALMISLDCHHPDLIDFINVKANTDNVTKANISIRVTDDFMRAVVNGDNWTMSFTRPETNETITKTKPAKEIFDLLCNNNWNYAEPGILFWDKISNWNLLSTNSEFSYAGTNPCFTGDTIIAVADGRNGVAIKDLCGTTFPVYSARYSKNRTRVPTLTNDNWVAEIKTAKAFKSGTKKVITVLLSDGSSFRCTPDHRLALADGNYCEAINSVGKRLGKFVTYSDKNTNKSYRHINSLTCNRQYRYIADYYNILQGNGLTVHHIDHDSTNDFPSNLCVVPFKEHMQEFSSCQKKDNTITRDINYAFNQGLRIITANGKRYGWSKEQIEEKKRIYSETHQDLYVEKIDQNVYLTDEIFVTGVIDSGEVEDVYDLTVEDNHNFYIITNTDDDKYLNCSGVLVHNCAEEPLPAGGSCLLGSINLAEFVTEDKKFNFDLFVDVVQIAVQYLNEVLDEGLPLHPLQEQREAVTNWRQIGLGIMGLADMLIKCELPYDSKDARDLCSVIINRMANAATQMSAKLAKEFGAYPKYTEQVLDSEYFKSFATNETISLVKQYGLRNSQLLTIAPTGTISTMLGISGGIEPIFANSYTRKTVSLHSHEELYKIYTPIVQAYMQKHNITDEKDLPNWFVESSTIAPIDRVLMQSVWQHGVDASISSTVNLPESATVQDIKDIYLAAWKNGLKGITVFRSGCKRAGILTTDDTQKIKEELKRGEIMTCSENLVGCKRKLQTGCGSLHVLAFFDPSSKKLREVYFTKGSTGGCANFMTGLSRIVSLACRAGVDIYTIKDQLDSTGACPSYASRSATKHDTSIGSCCPMAIGNALVEMYEEFNKTEENEKEVEMDICPICGGPLAHEGCGVCKICGYSRCGG